jgi:tRNA (guanine37-N1)-methyltransferase
MRVDIITIFPDMFRDVFGVGIIRRASEAGLVEIHVHDLRNWARDRHRSTDDTPYGGGPGMVMKPVPLVEAVEDVVCEEISEERREVILLSPRGMLLNQAEVERVSKKDQVVFVAGRYEGVDERFLTATAAREFSIGDYVLSGGEIPAMVLVDAMVRLIPGAISDPDSARQDSFNRGLLDYPHYTRPAEFRGLRVPEVLLSGNHSAIRHWRKSQAVETTVARRPDLLSRSEMDEEEIEILKGLDSGKNQEQ